MTGSAVPLPLPNLEPVRPVLGPPQEIASHPHGDQGHQEGLLLLNTIPGMNPAQGSPPRPARGAGAHPGGGAGGRGRQVCTAPRTGYGPWGERPGEPEPTHSPV